MLVREMLAEQIIEFDLKEPGPLGCIGDVGVLNPPFVSNFLTVFPLPTIHV